jgi:hypothetical protein
MGNLSTKRINGQVRDYNWQGQILTTTDLHHNLDEEFCTYSARFGRMKTGSSFVLVSVHQLYDRVTREDAELLVQLLTRSAD